jgi:hypothetical protein
MYTNPNPCPAAFAGIQTKRSHVMCTHFSTKNPKRLRRYYLTAGLVLLVLGLMLPMRAEAVNPCTTAPTYTANVVLFDTPMVFNRLGAQNPNWMMYALARDVVAIDPVTGARVAGFIPSSNLALLTAGEVALRPDKRPRPLVLRMPAESCLQINFKNLLDPVPNPFNPALAVPNALPNDIVDINPNANLVNNNQVVGRYAGVHVQGMQLVSSSTGNAIDADGSNVGAQGDIIGPIKGGLVDHGQTITYTLYAESEGAFLLSNQGATFGGEASGGNAGVGAFGMVAVQPKGARIYRSQVTDEEFRLAIDPLNPSAGNDENGNPQPRLDYEATYPDDCENQPDDPIPADGLKPSWQDPMPTAPSLRALIRLKAWV